MQENTFVCIHCKKPVTTTGLIGTKNRNHCPFCFFSKHVDEKIPGDRKAPCQQEMQPIALTFKKEGPDKYGKKKQGEIMLVHQCTRCQQYNINRIAADDDPNGILDVWKTSLTLPLQIKEALEQKGITICEEKDKEEIEKQLFGKI